MSMDLIAEARRLASFAPEKPESVHDAVCAGFNALDAQLAARMRDFLAAVERNEEKDRRIADLVEQNETLRNGCEQALLLLERIRFENDSEAQVVRAVLRSALGSNPAREPKQ